MVAVAATTRDALDRTDGRAAAEVVRRVEVVTLDGLLPFDERGRLLRHHRHSRGSREALMRHPRGARVALVRHWYWSGKKHRQSEAVEGLADVDIPASSCHRRQRVRSSPQHGQPNDCSSVPRAALTDRAVALAAAQGWRPPSRRRHSHQHQCWRCSYCRLHYLSACRHWPCAKQ